MDPGAVIEALRTAFVGDLVDGLRVLEEGLVELEGAEDRESAAARLREVFRTAHGLKGGARAASLPAIEATCHLMESLLGAARDQGRRLRRQDFAALLAAVDALREAEGVLSTDPRAEIDPASFETVSRWLGERLGLPTAAATATPASAPATPASAAALPATAAAPPASAAVHPERSADAPAAARSRGTPAAAAPAPPPEHGRRPRTGLRLAPERLDALAVAGGALLAAAHQTEAKARGVEALAEELRRSRRELLGARRLLARAAEPDAARRGRDARAARRALTALDDLQRIERGLGAMRAQLALDGRALDRRTRRLAAEIRGLRLTPWGEATAGLERAARDVADARGREVEVAVEGEGLELDKSVVDALRDPLAQLVRNAVDHGIEAADERRAAGKPARGRVEVSARVEGERVFVTVRDDGRGLDPGRLRDEARRRGLPPPRDARRALELVFVPGFSTATEVTELSGRGVGLDVVASAVRAMRGSVSVSSTPGRGTTFELAVPATLYGLRAVLARAAGQLFAVPALDVERIVRLSPDRVATSEGRPVLLDGTPVPLSRLEHALGLARGAWSVEDLRLALLVEAGGQRAAFAVDEILAERELSLEPLGPRLEGVTLATALAPIPGGEIAVVLSTRELVDGAVAGTAPDLATRRPAEAARRRRVLLADDAATTRALGTSILEASGYDVLPAADGEQAWALLQQQGADAVVSDVEMPRMDGFELTRAVRASPRFAKLPVVLLTALESEDDRRRGLEAGADAYLVKAAFDQRVLLETLSELLEDAP